MVGDVTGELFSEVPLYHCTSGYQSELFHCVNRRIRGFRWVGAILLIPVAEPQHEAGMWMSW